MRLSVNSVLPNSADSVTKSCIELVVFYVNIVGINYWNTFLASEIYTDAFSVLTLEL